MWLLLWIGRFFPRRLNDSIDDGSDALFECPQIPFRAVEEFRLPPLWAVWD